MRVISGRYKGRKINGFDIDGTRPTMDRVKESIFGMIQSRIRDSVCLDLFAGSGSLGIEALSNGALKCYFVEKNREMVKILKENLRGISDSVVMSVDYKEALDYFVYNGIKFDVIFLDPPYRLHLINDILQYIFNHDLLSDSGIVVCEYEDEELGSEGLLKFKKYGAKKVSIFKY